jgi:hypothetical protein
MIPMGQARYVFRPPGWRKKGTSKTADILRDEFLAEQSAS